MPLPTFASLDEVPEAFRSEYEMADGKAVSKDVAKLTAAIAKERAERDAAAKSAKDAEKRAAELELQAKAAKAGMTDEQLSALRAEFDAKVAPEREARTKAEAQLRAMQLDASLKSTMATSGVRAERIDTLWKLVSDRFDLTDSGTPMVKDDPTTDVAKAVAGLVKEYPEFFAAPPASGGGAGKSAQIPAANDADTKLLMTNPRALLERANMQGKAA